MNIIDYKLLCSKKIIDMTKGVNLFIAKGYQPFGAPFATDENNFFQAVVKLDTDKNCKQCENFGGSD